MKYPTEIIADTLTNPRPGVTMPVQIMEALRAAGWHHISTPTLEERDDPPVPDQALETPRYGFDALRITRLSAHLDGEVITAGGTIDRYLLAQARHEGYADHVRAQIGRDFLSMLGYKLGVPGCEDVPDRLAKTGHV